MKDSFDVTELLPFLDAKNATHPDYKTTVFHALIMSVARMLKERPKMNYFIQGRRMYERFDISLSFVCKRRFQDNGEEALMFFIPKEDETLDSMSYRIAGEVQETRKSESSTGGIDAVIDGFAKIPRLLRCRLCVLYGGWISGASIPRLSQTATRTIPLFCSPTSAAFRLQPFIII